MREKLGVRSLEREVVVPGSRLAPSGLPRKGIKAVSPWDYLS